MPNVLADESEGKGVSFEPTSRGAYRAASLELELELEAGMAHRLIGSKLTGGPSTRPTSSWRMDPLDQLARALADRYLVEREIGAGGMATVYLARDLKHDRRVALKVLKPEIGAVLGVERFLAEIRVTANLQHPNLLPLFDSGEVDGMLFYVMPFVEGETLRARLQRELQLPVDEAVRITAAIAGALEYAHSHGVIHRDLKPENILLQSGEPVVSDFGIALAVSKAGGARITQTGLSLGTPQYMSPEQAAGDRTIDPRSDIYSLGAVAYEMLAGEPPHVGPTVQAIIARVITDPARDVREMRPRVPEHVALAITRALEKVAADRWPTGRAFADALQGRGATGNLRENAPASMLAYRRARSRWKDPLVLGLSALALGALGVAGVLAARESTEEPEMVRFAITTKGPEQLGDLAWPIAVSRDGGMFAYGAKGESGRGMVLLRQMRTLETRRIEGIETPVGLAFSPDAKWIATRINRTRKLVKVPVEGGPAVELADMLTPGRISWADADLIVYSVGSVLRSVPATGGTPRAILPGDTAANRQVNPWVLSDGRTIVYASIPRQAGGISEAVLAVTTTDGADPVRSTIKSPAPLGVLEGHLVYVRPDGTVMAVRFDARSRRIQGEPFPIERGVTLVGLNIMAALSPSGTLVHSSSARDQELVWLDAKGSTRPAATGLDEYWLPRVSPDGRRLAFYGSKGAGNLRGSYWTYDIPSQTLTQVSPDSTLFYGEWLAGSREMVFHRSQDTSVIRQAVDGSAPLSIVIGDGKFHYFVPHPDGRRLLYTSWPTVMEGVLFVRALSGDTASARAEAFPGGEWAPRFSPDGRWLAYHATVGGVDEVYVRPFPGPGPRVQVSQGGGTEPVWSPKGDRIYYRSPTRGVKVARVVTSPAFAVLDRSTLAEGDFQSEWDVASYDVSPTTGELLLSRFTRPDIDIIVTRGWQRALRERMANGK